eukprot:4795450-Alexandrium_andersonii.AAC.1
MSGRRRAPGKSTGESACRATPLPGLKRAGGRAGEIRRSHGARSEPGEAAPPGPRAGPTARPRHRQRERRPWGNGGLAGCRNKARALTGTSEEPGPTPSKRCD